ncbi:hypothetical protein [Actinokineospora globicatena]|uniref:hypothetical protein n=1 Tax=Actinokineospora globicatena TaxID=103729 RepID=UPI0020A3059C|nr:hypothetical protein [Actinokineospora globicatena]MCP2301814.1 hypothetical protein [Actinokineospora globicatena]GLW76528.1 hypothetical protein Aglo01_10100 [Actinokineospora globicatena]
MTSLVRGYGNPVTFALGVMLLLLTALTWVLAGKDARRRERWEARHLACGCWWSRT